MVLHLWSAGRSYGKAPKPKPQKADLALLTSLKESLKTKKKKQQYLCLAFFRKTKTRVLQEELTYKCKKLKKGQYFEKQIKPIESNNSYDSGKYTVSL